MSEEPRPAAYLADIMCKRKGKKENLPTPIGYWNLPEWKLFFKQQILAANRLLKIYPFEVVVAAVSGKKCLWIYSLFYPGLNQVLEEENAKYERKLKREEIIAVKMETREETRAAETAPKILSSENSLRNRLD